MRVDPVAGSVDLCEAVRDAWDLPARRVEFLPLGESPAASYRIECADGRRFHLKLVLSGQREAEERIRNGFYLSLMRQLEERSVLAVPAIAPPVGAGATGALHVPLALDGPQREALLVLTGWIEAAPIEPMGLLPASVRAPLPHAIAALHGATKRLDLAGAAAEDFSIPFDAGLREALPRLDRDAPAELRRVVGPWRARIEAELDALLRVRERACALDPPQVLCHTDLHGGNMLLDPQGTLWILDWEDARLAPAEQDLAGATNSHVPHAELASFVAAYRAGRRAPKPEADLFEFYFRRRCLEDLEIFLRDILSGAHSAEQDAHDLALLTTECLGWIERMAHDVRFVRDALSGVRT